jgi:hypothetical protein
VSVRACGVLALGLLVVCSTSGCGGDSTLAASSLAKRAEAVQSLAAEGALLAGDSAAGKTIGVYRHEHASELSSSAAKAATSLASASTTSALEPKLVRLRALAGRVTSRLQRLEDASTTESRVLARELQAAADASAKLGNDLG